MKKYINLKIFQVIFLIGFLLLSSGVSLNKFETRTINNNLNNNLDLQAMAIHIEQLRIEYLPVEPELEPEEEPEPETTIAPEAPQEERQPYTRTDAPMAHTQDDLWWLALVIHLEAGSNWLTDEHQLKVGNVVLNRVASNRFAGTTIHAILHQPGQYPWATNSSHPQPSERAIRNAQRLLDGERFLPSNVIWQANFRQGSACYSIIHCPRGIFRPTYFCY